jgi:two-component system response regulator (stage 0 sporulation protein F)
MNVLVVESNSGIAQLLSSFLRRCGHVVDEASYGREAIRRLQSSRYDIVITDSEIIGVDGAELCKYIKAHFQDIYIIGISGYLSALKDLADAGADVCFSKPFDIDQVRKAIDCRTALRKTSVRMPNQNPSSQEKLSEPFSMVI